MDLDHTLYRYTTQAIATYFYCLQGLALWLSEIAAIVSGIYHAASQVCWLHARHDSGGKASLVSFDTRL